MSQNFNLEKFSQEFDRRMGKSSDSAQGQGYKPPSISLDNTGEISIEQQDGGEKSGFVNAPPVEDVLSLYGSLENSVQNEVQDIGSGLHALKNNMNLSPLEARKLQLASGLPPNFVDMDPGFARKKIASDQYAESLQAFSDNIHQTPNTLDFLREANALDQLAITQDKPLTEIERSVDSEGLGFFDSGVIGTARNAWDVGMVGRELNKLYLKEMYGSSLTDEEEQQMRVFTSALNYYDKLGDKMPLPQRMVRGTVGSVAVPLYGSAEGGVRGLTRLGTTMASAGATYGALAGGGVFSAPAAVAGAMTGLGAAATGGAVLDMMEQEGAAIYGTLRAMEDESGNKIDRDVARTLAVIGGGISGGLEYASFHMLGRMVPQLERFISPEAAATSLKYLQQHPSLMAKVSDTLKSALRAFAGETSTEVAQEGVSIVAEELGRKLSNVNSAGQSADEIKDRLWQTAQQAAEAMAIPIAAGGGMRLARGVKAQNRMDTAIQSARDYQNNLMDTVAKAAQTSEVFKDMPETGEALLQHLSDSGVTPGQIFIKPETVQKIFFQDENPDLVQAARDMGITPESLEENLTLGTDVAVDFSKAATHILREPERYEAMRPDMRFDPAMPTDVEIHTLEGMNEDNQTRLEYLNSILDPIVDEENQALSRHEARMETVASYVQQMQDAGFSEAQAKAYGTILAANAERMSEVFGMTPKEYLESRLAGYVAMTPDEFKGDTIQERFKKAKDRIKYDDATADVSETGSSTQPDISGFYQDKDGKSPRGGMRQLADGRYVVALFKKADASTILHETAHFWLEELRDAAKLDSSPEWVREAWAKLQQAYGFDGTLEGQESAARWTETQERFAREFEAYAREGKAPSWELQSAFNKFRNWITDIYKSVKTLLGTDNISPAASEVFDSLLATQEEIDLSQRRANGGSVLDLLGDSVKPELRDRYAKAAQAAYDNASAAIANRRLVERRRVEREFKAAATESVNASPVHTMLQALRTEGIDFDALKQAISEDVAYKLRDKWKGTRWEGKALIRSGGKLDLLDVAARFNEDTVQGLAAKLMETPTKREAIAADVQQRLQAWERDFDAEVEYTSAMDQAMAIEMEAITGKKQPSPAALRREVDLLVGAKKLKDVDAQYKTLKARLQNEARGARRAWAEAKKEARADMSDMRSEFRAKIAGMQEQERIRRAALGAAYRARIERDNIVSQLRKVASSKTVNDAYQQQILRIISSWKGLGTETMAPRDVQAMPSLSDFMQSNVSLFEEPSTLAPDWLISGTTGRAGDLSITQLRDLHSLVKELAHMGRVHDRMLASREKSRISVVASNCAQQMGKLSQRKFLSDREGILGTIQGGLRKGLSSLTSVRFLARALDGFTDSGVNHDAWLNPLQQAQTDELKLRRQMGDLLREALSPIVQAGRMTKAFTMDGIALQKDVSRLWKGMWDMDKVYSVAMNMGNAGNIKALMRGYGWTEQDLHAITSRMTENEWRAVEKTWEAINTLYPRLNEVYQAMKGVPLPKVEAQELTVVTADGKTITLKGGYYPLIFDHRLSGKAAELTSADQMLNGMEAVLRSPNPKSGMTKARQGGTLPPRLSLDVIDQHVNDTTHYVTHVLPLRDTMRLFNDASFKEAFVGAAGQENYSQLLPWLRGIARPGGEQATGMLAVMDWLARRGTMYALGANMKSAILQLTSVGNSWGEVGMGNFFKASATILSSPLQSWKTISEKSAYMQQRAMLMDDTLRREYERMRSNGVGGVRFMGAQYALDTVQRAQFALISSLDAVVAYPTWLAAYDKAIAGGLEESVAIARADGAVVAAQGGGGALDTPAAMRQVGLMRMLCPFMSFALSDFNRKMEQVRGLTEWARTGNSSMTPAKAFQAFAFQWVMPVALSALLVSLGRDDDLPDEEDYAWEAAGFLSMGIPVVRDVTRMAESHFSSDGFKGGRTPLMLAGLDNAIRGAGHAATALEEDDDDATYLALKETTNAVGFLLGLGTPQLWRTIEGSNAYFVDDEGGVLAPLLGKPRAQKD